MKGRGKGNEWLLIKKRDQYADVNWDVEAHARSVKTGRTQEEIAENLPAVKKAAVDRRRPPRNTSAKKTAAPKRTVKKKPSEAGLTPADIQGARQADMPSAVAPMMAYLADRPGRQQLDLRDQVGRRTRVMFHSGRRTRLHPVPRLETGASANIPK